MEWTKKRLLTAVEVRDCQELKERISTDLTLVYFGEFEGVSYDLFLTCAKSNEKYISYKASGTCAKVYGAESDSTLMIFRSFDELSVEYKGEMNV